MENNSNEHKTRLDEDSFKMLFDLHFESICEFLRYYTLDKDVIKDVVQDIFVKLWKERENIDLVHIKTYFYRAARNQMLNQIRNEQNRIHLLQNWAIIFTSSVPI